MKVDIVIPQMGESVNEAVVATILKPDGSYVELDEEIIELETDKVNQVLSAPQAGKLTLLVKEEELVTIGQVIGHVETEAKAGGERPKAAAPSPAAEKSASPEEPQSAHYPPPGEAPPPRSSEAGVRSGAAEYIGELKEGGPSPIRKEGTRSKKSVLPGERETREKMSKIRQVIAKRLLEAQHTAAMLTTFNEIDMTAVMEARSRYKDLFAKRHGIKLGFMSWFVKGCVAALHELPGLNSYIEGEEIVRRHYYDIGIAVGTKRGLMVPVVRDCDQLSFAEIEEAIVEYANQAREGKISVDSLQGGSFTITNGGIYGSLLSTPILNPPQSGILGMHKIQERPMVVEGEIRIRPMMYIALSYDHRIVDGQEAVTFLVRLKEFLEDPSRLLLDL